MVVVVVVVVLVLLSVVAHETRNRRMRRMNECSPALMCQQAPKANEGEEIGVICGS